MGGSGSGRKRESSQGFGKNRSLSLADDIASFSISNPEANFILFNKDKAKELQEREKRQQVERERLERFAYLDLDSVPSDPKEFYVEAGYPIQKSDGSSVYDLADYQWEIWYSMFDHKYVVVTKSQKIGVSTAVLLAVLQMALLPKSHPMSCRGNEILVIAQSLKHAHDHIRTMREMILRSKYADVMRTGFKQVTLFKDQTTKVGTIFLDNPSDMSSPTKIIGLGPKEGGIWSFKKVKYVHISDIAATQSVTDYSPSINAALTRLANTNGGCIIESPPRGFDYLYEIWKKAVEEKTDDNKDVQFWPIKIPVQRAVDAGIVTQEYLDRMKAQMGSQYKLYFEAEFAASVGDLFNADDIEYALKLGKYVDVANADSDFYHRRAMGVDLGFGSSDSAISILQLKNNKVETVFSQQYHDMMPTSVLDQVWLLYQRYNVHRMYVDGWNVGYVRELKLRLGEDSVGFEKEIARLRGVGQNPAHFMRCVPINFGLQGKAMVANTQFFMTRRLLAIPEEFGDLVADIRSAREKNGDIDKSANVKRKMDSFDSFRLAMLHFKPLPVRPTNNPIPQLSR